MKSPFDIRKDKVFNQAKRLLFTGGVPPVKHFLYSIVDVLIPVKNRLQSKTKPSSFSTGDLIKASDVIKIAEDLREDTEVLQEWSSYAESKIENDFQKRNHKRINLERRLNNLISISSELENYKSEGLQKGKGSLSTVINFSDLSLIDFSRTTVDIIPSAGIAADGEAVLSKNPLNSRQLNPDNFEIQDTSFPNGTEILSDVSNIFKYENDMPFQVVVPGASEEIISIVFSLNRNKQTELISGLEIEGSHIGIIKVFTSLDSKVWTLKETGKLSSLNKTSIRFINESVSYIKLELSPTSTAESSNGYSLGIKKVKVYNASYINEGFLYTNKLLADAAPLQGVRLNIDSKLLGDSSIDIEVSFASATGNFIKSKRLSNKISGNDMVIWNPLSSKENNIFDSIIQPSDGSRFWKIPISISNAIKWDADIYAGINQWYLESKEVNYSILDNPYKVPTLDEWDTNSINYFNKGAFIEPQLTLIGDIKQSATLSPVSGSFNTKGFIFKNQYSYGTEETVEHFVAIAYASNTVFMKPGNAYKITSYVHCTKETSFELTAEVPGALYDGGTISFSYCLNGKPILSAGENQLEGLAGWLDFSANVSFISGWNKIEILLYRPDTTNETDPASECLIRFSLDPLSDKTAQLYNISKMRCKLEPLIQTNEFNLKVLSNPGRRVSWAWEENVDDPDIVLADSWGHSTSSIYVDGTIVGSGARFETNIRKGDIESSPGVWIKGTFRGASSSPPEIRNIKIEAL